MLLATLLTILEGWIPIFPQRRSGRRAISQALGSMLCFGRRTLSRSIWALGKQNRDWSAEYKLHARSRWSADGLFQPMLERALPLCSGPYVVIAMDDTRVRKTGRKILSAFYQRDPLSPKFRFNLMWGLRFLQMTLLVPLYRSQPDVSPRSLPIRFHEVPALKRPGKKASEADWQAYREAVKLHNLSQHAVSTLRDVRDSVDVAGMSDRPLLAVGDASFCNRTLFRCSLDRVQLLMRARKDIRLCHRAPIGQRAFYGVDKFTPEQIRQDESHPWQFANVFHGGQWRQLRYKSVSDVYWQGGAGQRCLRVLVVAPVPYDSGKGKRKYYRDPAFLLTTDGHTEAEPLLQAYFDRWQIEVNHREEKDTLGVGQAQLRNSSSVPRQPALVVAAYSALLLAGILVYDSTRTADFPTLPKWRRNASRPSCLDLVTVLRSQLTHDHHAQSALGIQIAWKTLGLAAAA
jgi:DDE superfamily endonuclease